MGGGKGGGVLTGKQTCDACLPYIGTRYRIKIVFNKIRYDSRVIDQMRQRLMNEGRIDLMFRVRPHAAQSQFVDILDDGSVKIDIAAPAEDGKGNVALCRFIGELFNVPAVNVKILSGKTARLKLVRVTA